MSVILPGNWVTHANVYPRKKKLANGSSVIERHGVECIPGYAFYKLVGYYATSDDTLAAGDYDLVIGSPDLRQDDKPRLDAPFVLPKGAQVYRTAVRVVNGMAAANPPTATDTVTVKDAAPAAVSTADANGKFPAAVAPTQTATALADAGKVADFNGITAQTSDVTVQVTTGDVINRDDKRNWLVILVEVDYIYDAGAPELDEIHAPYLTEAGSDKAY